MALLEDRERGEERLHKHEGSEAKKTISMDNEKDNLLLYLTLKISFTFITAKTEMSKCDRVQERGTGWTDAKRVSKKSL